MKHECQMANESIRARATNSKNCDITSHESRLV